MLWRVPTHTTVEIDRPTPPDTYPPIKAEHRTVSPVTAGVAGLAAGAAIGAGIIASRKLVPSDADAEKEA
jgi:hypothetical protein